MTDRVEVHDDEAAAVGVTLGSVDWGNKLRPVLVAKGFPEEDLWLGNPAVRAFRDDVRKVVIFTVSRANG